MKHSLSEHSLQAISESLSAWNRTFVAQYPGESAAGSLCNTVYGGAHLFRADSVRRLGQVAERALAENAPDFVVFARAIGLPLAQQLPDVLDYATGLRHRLEIDAEAVRTENKPAWLAHAIYTRVQGEVESRAGRRFSN